MLGEAMLRRSVTLSGEAIRLLTRSPHHKIRRRNSNLHFKADLDDLVRRYPEVGGRQIGIEVHRREYTLSPYRHPGHFAARNNHHSSRVERDLLRVDPAQTGVAAGESQPLHDIGMFHKS